MVKIDKNLTDLKGQQLFIGKYPIGKLDVVETKGKNGNALYLLFVQGDKWTGDIVAETQDNFLVMFKGSLYGRKAVVTSQKAVKVGSI